MKNDPKKRKGFGEFFPLDDNILLFFLSILDDEEQKRLEESEEDDEPQFEKLDFDDYSGNDLEKDFRLDNEQTDSD